MTPSVKVPDARRDAFSRRLRAVPSRDLAGLATLEWLLVIAAAGGFAAAMAVGFQGLIDDASSADDNATTKLIDVGIAAARISDDAVAALIALEDSSGNPEQTAVARARLDALAQQCQALETAHPEAVESAEWAWLAVPVEIPASTPTAAPGDEPPPTTADPGTTQDPTVTTAPIHDAAAAPSLTDGRWVCRIVHRAP